MDLSVNFMGLQLKNPIMVASSPLTRNGEEMKKAIEAGAGAVITETITSEIRRSVKPCLASNEFGMQNIYFFSEYALEDWEYEIEQAKDCGGTVIANIVAYSASEMAYIAKRVEKFGADAVELCLSTPYGDGIEVLASEPEKVYEFVDEVVKAVEIPVMVKLSPSVNNVAKLAKAAEKAGAAAISGINTIRSILGVDIEKGKTLLPTYGGYSGPAIRPISLAFTATVAQATNLPICGIGGIDTYYHVLEYMMLGANTVQICTSAILNGYGHIRKLIQDLEKWMKDHHYESFEQIRGKALDSLKSFEEMKVEPYIADVADDENDTGGKEYESSCVYGAIYRNENRLKVDPEKCTGCGLCANRWPDIFKMIWKE